MTRGARVSWYLFDVGNSAHAVMISTVGFALYYRQYLLAGNVKADSIWGALNAVVLAVAAIASPPLGAYLAHCRRRGLGVTLTTVLCVGATATLASPLADYVVAATVVYALSALGYYLALPMYNSFLPDIEPSEMERTSARGWGFGYSGGIVVVGLCLALGLISRPVTEAPGLFRQSFLVAALFNGILSVPICIWALRRDAQEQRQPQRAGAWSLRALVDILRKRPALLRLLVSYWLLGECATIVLYFTAIFLAEYGHLAARDILLWSLAVQLVAAVTTAAGGMAAVRWGSRRAYRVVAVLWTAVPFLLYAVTLGVSYKWGLGVISLVLGAYHAIVRAEVARIAADEEQHDARGGMFGYLEVAGRVTSVLGPLFVAAVASVTSLAVAVLASAVFPVAALLVVRGYRWRQA